MVINRLGPSSRFSRIYLKENALEQPTGAFSMCPGQMSGPRGAFAEGSLDPVNQNPRHPGSASEATPKCGQHLIR